MSRGRGGGRGRGSFRVGRGGKAMIGGQEVSWDYDEDVENGISAKPQETFPPIDLPQTQPPTYNEKLQIEHYRAFRKRIHHGPLHTVLGDDMKIGKQQRSRGAKFDPFHGMSTYTQKYKRQSHKTANFGTHKYPLQGFPPELWETLLNLMAHTSTLATPLASIAQLESSGSQLDGVPADLENSIRYQGCRLTQAAGALLRLPQDLVAQAIVIFTRFWIGPEGGSMKYYGAEDISAASVYLVAKLSAHPKSPRSVLNVYAYLASRPDYPEGGDNDPPPTPESYFLSDGTYYARRNELLKHEAIVLRTMGFQTHVALPYTLCINYLQALEVFNDDRGKKLAKRAFAHLNTLLLSPQLIYVTHQPPQIATAAIYLAARETGVKLPEEEWWEVFDTDREELGFLVVAMTSMGAFAAKEKNRWTERKTPVSINELQGELERRRLLDEAD
ncbi:hypothetical protein FH972_021735 [Carpinus fangiana]|uniref:B-like cyclin n=1 Tax=Carpinus fangiana TaxID=176857 RepID=A0A5N6KQJ3_9ROSI|nr:hypothetical protein FH972_021735 [Carpinus fangiana]